VSNSSTFSFKTLVRDLLLILALLWLGDWLVGRFVVPLFAPEAAPRFRSGNPDPNRPYGLLRSAALARADLLILGSSRALAHYDDQLLSQALGLRAYNAGSPGFGLLQARITFALAQKQHPVRYVLFDMVYVPREDRMIHRLEPWLGNDPVVAQVLASPDWRDRLKMRSHAYRCGGSLFDLVADYGKSPATWGFRPKQGELTAPPGDSEISESNEALPAYYGSHLEEFARQVKGAGAQLIFVESPSWRQSYPGVPTRALRQCYERVAREHQIPLLKLGLQELPQLAYSRYFSDVFHLNASGAGEFSRVLAARLKRLKDKSSLQ
jgi:hypothetical protein